MFLIPFLLLLHPLHPQKAPWKAKHFLMLWNYLLWSLGVISTHLEWSLLSCFQYSFGKKKKKKSCISIKEPKSFQRVSGAISELICYLPAKPTALTANMGLSLEGMNYKYSVILCVLPDWRGKTSRISKFSLCRRFINPLSTFIFIHSPRINSH